MGEQPSEDRVYTFYADARGVVTIVCPFCSREKEVDATRYKQGVKNLTVSCPCGHQFKTHLELRQSPRKRVQLTGEYTHLETQEMDDILIQDLSLTGVRFTIQGPHGVRTGDRLRISFTLETPLRPVITREVEITGVHSLVVHGRFVNVPARDADLGFFLMSQPKG